MTYRRPITRAASRALQQQAQPAQSDKKRTRGASEASTAATDGPLANLSPRAGLPDRRCSSSFRVAKVPRLSRSDSSASGTQIDELEDSASPMEFDPPQRPRDVVLRERLVDLGLTVVPDPVDDESIAPYAKEKSYLGVIITLLHGAGLEGAELLRRASDVHDDVSKHDTDILGDALRSGEELDPRELIFPALAKRIFEARDESNWPAVLIMKAGVNGSPELYDLANVQVDPATVSHDTVVFIESDGRFEAVANTSGRPWPAVLAQLLISPEKPEDERNAAWIRHCIRAVQEVELTTINHLQSHVWKRGEPLDVEWMNMRTEPGPSKQAQLTAEAQAVVEKFWAALAQHPITYEREQTSSNEGNHSHSLDVNLGSGILQGAIEVRDGRILSLRVHTDNGDIVAKYEHPWSRPVIQTPARQALTCADDLDAYDEAELLALSHNYPLDMGAFADFLIDLRKQGPKWEELRERQPKVIEGYVKDAVDQGRLAKSALWAVRWVLNPHGKASGKLSSGKKLDSADAKRLNNFYRLAMARKSPAYTSVFAAFLEDLRAHGKGMRWPAFCELQGDEINQYMCKAMERGLHASTLAVLSFAMKPEENGKRSSQLKNANHQTLFERFQAWTTDNAKSRDYPTYLRRFLAHLESTGDMSWRAFSGLSKKDRNAYMKEAIPDLGYKGRSAVQRAHQLLTDPTSDAPLT